MLVIVSVSRLDNDRIEVGVATFRRKNAVSEAALVRCGRNGVAFAVQFRLLSSINGTER